MTLFTTAITGSQRQTNSFSIHLRLTPSNTMHVQSQQSQGIAYERLFSSTP